MNRIFAITYGGTAYVLFLGVFLYLIAFTMNMAPHSVSGPATMPAVAAVAIDIALVTLFALQHTIMARPAFKRKWTRIVPKHLERSTFVLVASAMVLLMITCWQPIDGLIWNLTGPAAMAMYVISVIGFLGVPLVSLITDHFHLFGLRQVYEFATGRPQSAPVFKMVGPYKAIRHPMMLSFLVAFWATPTMTAGHLLFASLMTFYIQVGVYFEERSLAAEHGKAYRDYQSNIPKLMPVPSGRTQTKQVAASTAR